MVLCRAFPYALCSMFPKRSPPPLVLSSGNFSTSPCIFLFSENRVPPKGVVMRRAEPPLKLKSKDRYGSINPLTSAGKPGMVATEGVRALFWHKTIRAAALVWPLAGCAGNLYQTVTCPPVTARDNVSVSCGNPIMTGNSSMANPMLPNLPSGLPLNGAAVGTPNLPLAISSPVRRSVQFTPAEVSRLRRMLHGS